MEEYSSINVPVIDMSLIVEVFGKRFIGMAFVLNIGIKIVGTIYSED